MNKENNTPNRLYCDQQNKRIFGVCAGIAEYFDFNVTIVRLLTVIGVIVFSVPVIAGYLALALILDKKPERLYQDSEHEKFWRHLRTSPSSTMTEVRHKCLQLENRLQRLESYVTSTEYQFDKDLNK